jgi:hypothetical protein
LDAGTHNIYVLSIADLRLLNLALAPLVAEEHVGGFKPTLTPKERLKKAIEGRKKLFADCLTELEIARDTGRPVAEADYSSNFVKNRCTWVSGRSCVFTKQEAEIIGAHQEALVSLRRHFRDTETEVNSHAPNEDGKLSPFIQVIVPLRNSDSLEAVAKGVQKVCRLPPRADIRWEAKTLT